MSEPATLADLTAILTTSKGAIHLRLFATKTPVTVANFLNLAQRGYYNGVLFHRVIPGFMMQGGDPTGTGSGGPGYEFEDEFDSTLRFDRAGLLAMANRGPRTNGSQFFITYAPTPHLNDHHTIFGEVVKGVEVPVTIQRGDHIESISTADDTTALFAAQAINLARWNQLLDRG
ncbi:MAG TPA: peptidylprolyl isomerase [Nevskiaceae bacterium]|nr:peptidylprolyl isomerase [Nevskiaceae bacterium]